MFVSAGTLFAERLLDGVVLSTWILFGALAIGQGGADAPHRGRALGESRAGGRPRRLGGPRPRPRRALRLEGDPEAPPRWPRASRARLAHFVDGLGAFRGRSRLVAIFGTSAAMWLADVAMYWVVGEFGFDLNLPVRAYFLLEGIGNLALAVPATAAGIGTFDYLTLLAAKGIDVNPDKATAYVLTMHALAVLPVTIMGAVLVSPTFPRLLGRRREPARESG